MQDDGKKIRSKSAATSVVSCEISEVIDNPCWGSPTQCSLSDLLELIDRTSAILFESDDYIVLNKPPDLRMDGDFPSSVHKLLTYWYPSESIRDDPNLLEQIAKLVKLNDLADNQLRPCHQLDYATSGALLVGRNRKAAGKACEAFRERTTQKAYLAIVHSHLQVDKCEMLSLSLQSDVYQHIRAYDQEVADRRKAKRKTFNGFQPPSSIFCKWKQFSVKGGGKRSRDSEMMQQVNERISCQDDRDTMGSMSWGEVKKNAEWKLVFEDVAKVYNESLKQENALTGNINSSKKVLELPGVFRLEEDADPNVFYVNVSLAQHPSDFAMVIHPSVLKRKGETLLDPQLDFKLAITRCTILKHSHINGSTRVTKMRLQPLTGRRHQLRCHMKVVDAPIVGDATYEDAEQPQNLVERMCLHAFQLEIAGVIETTAPDPFVMKEDTIQVRIV